MPATIRCAFNRPRLSFIASLIACWGVAASTLAGEVEYTATMKDMMSIQATLHRYHEGLDKHDNQLWASAFADDGTMTMINHDKQMTLTRDQIAKNGLMGNGPPGAGGGAGGPPPSGAPSPVAGAGALPAGMGELWHFSEINGSFKFESPTRATHSSYWMEVHAHEETNSSTLAVPGHYEDVLVKRKGEWLLLSRKVVIGEK